MPLLFLIRIPVSRDGFSVIGGGHICDVLELFGKVLRRVVADSSAISARVYLSSEMSCFARSIFMPMKYCKMLVPVASLNSRCR